jgi:TPR repeat protein
MNADPTAASLRQAVRALLLIAALALSLSGASGAFGGEYDTRLNNYPNGRKLHYDAVVTRSADAAYDLGLIYIEKIKDYDKTIQWFLQAYKDGKDDIKASSANNLGYAYSRKNNAKEAIKWYMIAIEGGIEKANYDLGIVYQDILKDYPSTIKWYEIAHKGGDKDAAYALGLLYEHKLKDYPSAIKWYETAHNRNDRKAAYSLGVLYNNQLKDYENAKKWYKIAYKQGDYRGIQAFGVLYHDQYNDKIAAGAYYMGLIGEYSKDEVISVLKSGWKLTDDDLKQSYKLHQTLDLPKHYTGGID